MARFLTSSIMPRVWKSSKVRGWKTMRIETLDRATETNLETSASRPYMEGVNFIDDADLNPVLNECLGRSRG